MCYYLCVWFIFEIYFSCLDNILKRLEFYSIIVFYIKICCFCLIIWLDSSYYKGGKFFFCVLFLFKLIVFSIFFLRKVKIFWCKLYRLLDVSCSYIGFG